MLNRIFKLTFMLVLVALIGSVAANYFLFKKAKEFYAREAEVRMTPINFRYAEANQKLITAGKSKPRIVIFGESRCGMWLPYHPTNWGNAEIVNRGIGGETTPQILGRLESDVLELKADLVVLQMGDNDLKTMAVLPGTREKTIESTYENIVMIAKTLSDHGIQVVITTIFPPAQAELLRKPLWSDEVNESIDIVNQRLLEFSYPGVVTVDCDSILRDGQYIKPEYSLDTLHLTAEGYAALNQGLEPIMRPLVEAINAKVD